MKVPKWLTDLTDDVDEIESCRDRLLLDETFLWASGVDVVGREMMAARRGPLCGLVVACTC